MKPFYITTAIDYTNGMPHIGHAYEKVLADVIARHRRLEGEEVFFLTGVDQHGQKVQQTAAAEGINIETYVAKTTEKFVALWEKLGVEYDGWAATTDPVHKHVVQQLLQSLHDKGELYKATHSGFYSVRQEQFLTDKERGEDGEFGPEWGEVEERTEENWYFKLGSHIPWLVDYIETHDDFIFPDYRKADVLNGLKGIDPTEADLCISRPKKRLQWGIELPFDTDFVTYIWFDALTNYISFAGYLKDGTEWSGDLPDFDKIWPCDAHIIGKDIMRPAHAVYWPIMLHAAGFADAAMPKLVVHGWWNDKKGEKQSKSLGNVSDPSELADIFGADGIRYYLMRDIATGKDANFDQDRLLDTAYNKELAGGLGNLINRFLGMAKRRGPLVTDYQHSCGHCDALRATVEKSIPAYREQMRGYMIHQGIESIWQIVTAANVYVDAMEPWALNKDESAEAQDTLNAVLHTLCEVAVTLGILLEPIIPVTAAKIRSQLRFELPEGFVLDDLKWGMLPAGHEVGKAKPLFPRVEIVEEEEAS